MQKPDSSATVQPDVAPPLFEPPRKLEWPAGIMLSKPEKHACFVSDDLCVLLSRRPSSRYSRTPTLRRRRSVAWESCAAKATASSSSGSTS